MELSHELTVELPVAEAWVLLTDLERIAPCMPGASLESSSDGTYTGTVKVKVGPVTAQYRGTVTFAELDETARRAVLRAEGRETKGQGSATATVTATLVPDGGATQVSIATDLTVTGRVAQFGRGVIAEVGARLLQQFVECLATTFVAPAGAAGADPSAPSRATAGGGASGGTGEGTATPSPEGARTATPAPTVRVDAVDLLDVARSMVSRRTKAVVAAGVAALVALVVSLRRGRRSAAPAAGSRQRAPWRRR